jgi:hypothetical protein
MLVGVLLEWQPLTI